ncbi:DUF3959 family protein [Bacillus sp. BP-3]|uniref:DUF3959 family protein n=1 Tax=Bacillus sp. BP-3 TaxID=3022773 RepID=UPI00232BBBFC|nr:DUF3959 family protein [Bacillus sp. BP-3]MDC2864340.1 DUF3959 family protein [Bacillus sp. BP-3]
MKKLDVLLMVLSALFPVTGLMKQMPLQLSLYIGGLLFLTSFGSYHAKRMHSRIFSWVAYASFITLLLAIWNQYITVDSLIANAKIAACIAIIPFLFRFRTYAITLGLLGLWGMMLWDVKQIQSLAVLQRMMNILTTEKLYLVILVAGFLLGGLLASVLHRDNNNQEKTNAFKQKQKRMRPTFKIRIPSLPRLKFKMLKFSKKSSKQRDTRKYEQNHQETAPTNHTTPTEQHNDVGTVQGQTRMERRRNRYNA